MEPTRKILILRKAVTCARCISYRHPWPLSIIHLCRSASPVSSVHTQVSFITFAPITLELKADLSDRGNGSSLAPKGYSDMQIAIRNFGFITLAYYLAI